MQTKHVTAVSLLPLPPGGEIREAVEEYLSANPRPGDVLRALADLLDAGEAPPPSSAVHEADTFLPDYRSRIFRRSYRCSEEHARALAGLARATGLAQTSIIRAALAYRSQMTGL